MIPDDFGSMLTFKPCLMIRLFHEMNSIVDQLPES